MRDTKFRTRLFLCFLAVIVMTLVLPGLYVRKNIKEDGIDETVRNARREAVLIRMQMETAPDGVHGLSSTFDRIGTELGIRITFIGADGQLVDVFRRVSVGWKDVRRTDGHYREGDGFHLFSYGGIRFATALCGDLWTPGRPEELAALGADAVLWPVWCDYPAAEWNEQVKLEYAAQASRCGCPVLYVNPFCVDPAAPDAATGGAACFSGGRIVCEAPAGESGILFVEL